MKLGMFADGNYSCWCSECGIGFAGDKRATNCMRCASKQLQAELAAEQEKNKRLHDALEVCEGCGNTTKIDDENYLLWCKNCWEKVVFENKQLREGIIDDKDDNPMMSKKKKKESHTCSCVECVEERNQQAHRLEAMTEDKVQLAAVQKKLDAQILANRIHAGDICSAENETNQFIAANQELEDENKRLREAMKEKE